MAVGVRRLKAKLRFSQRYPLTTVPLGSKDVDLGSAFLAAEWPFNQGGVTKSQIWGRRRLDYNSKVLSEICLSLHVVLVPRVLFKLVLWDLRKPFPDNSHLTVSYDVYS